MFFRTSLDGAVESLIPAMRMCVLAALIVSVLMRKRGVAR